VEKQEEPWLWFNRISHELFFIHKKNSDFQVSTEIFFFRQRISLFRHRMRFSPQSILCPLFLNEGGRIKQKIVLISFIINFKDIQV
jgi:hypothetical protein